MTITQVDLDALDPDLERNGPAALLSRRVRGAFSMDEWGLDRDLVTAVAPLARLRWSLKVDRAFVLPEIGPALLVLNRRIGLSEGSVLSSVVLHETGRVLRVLGAPERGPLAPVARKLGGVPGHAADVRSLLRAGELVGLPLDRQVVHPFHVGRVPAGPLAAALAAGAPIVPVAVIGLEAGRWWTVRFGRPIPTRRRSVVVDAAELAVATRSGLQQLLTENRRKRH